MKLPKTIHSLVNRMTSKTSYHPSLGASIDLNSFVTEAGQYFNIPIEAVNTEYQVYKQFHLQNNYQQALGERKTLCFEEAFLIFLAAKCIQPSRVVEIGTQYGKSTRRIIDILKLLQMDSSVTCFDVVDELKYVNHSEINLILEDVTDHFSERVLTEIAPGLIYLDAHPYHLLKNVIVDFLEWSKNHPSILAIHDCGSGLYNPCMKISKNNPRAVSSQTGCWERHVLSEIFAQPNNALDDMRTPTHRLHIFRTTHGLALLAPHQITAYTHLTT